MRARLIAFVSAIFLLGLAMGAWLLAPGTSEKTAGRSAQTPAIKPLEHPEITAEDIELVQGSKGKVEWKLRARRAEYDQDGGIVTVDLPVLISHLGEREEEIFVRADRGEVDQKTNYLTMKSNVDGRFGAFAITSQSLDYLGAMHKILLKGGVTVRGNGMVMRADAVEIDLTTRELLAAGGVNAEVAAETVQRELRKETP